MAEEKAFAEKMIRILSKRWLSFWKGTRHSIRKCMQSQEAARGPRIILPLRVDPAYSSALILHQHIYLRPRPPSHQKASETPIVRAVDWRPNGTMGVLAKPVETQRNMAAISLQVRGEQVPTDSICPHCAKGCGPFASCVVSFSTSGEPHFKGDCGNCHWGGDARCQLRRSPGRAPYCVKPVD
jgi:hypothetical protein